MSQQESASIIRNCKRIQNTFFYVSSVSPYNGDVHWQEDDPVFELLRFTLWFCQNFLNLFEDAQCSEFWEICPLELHRLSINSIQIFEIASLQMPIKFVLPSFDWLVSHASQTEHRVGEDIGFVIRNLKSFVT